MERSATMISCNTNQSRADKHHFTYISLFQINEASNKNRLWRLQL